MNELIFDYLFSNICPIVRPIKPMANSPVNPMVTFIFTMGYVTQKSQEKPGDWTAFEWIQKFAPRKIYFLADFIRTHLCASLDSGIGKCHRRQTWRYQGATVPPLRSPDSNVDLTCELPYQALWRLDTGRCNPLTCFRVSRAVTDFMTSVHKVLLHV